MVDLRSEHLRTLHYDKADRMLYSPAKIANELEVVLLSNFPY
jgi:hypothetical protein